MKWFFVGLQMNIVIFYVNKPNMNKINELSEFKLERLDRFSICNISSEFINGTEILSENKVNLLYKWNFF